MAMISPFSLNDITTSTDSVVEYGIYVWRFRHPKSKLNKHLGVDEKRCTTAI